MNFIAHKVAASLAVLSIILSPSAYAKALDDGFALKYFDKSLQECEAFLSHWGSAWRMTVGLAVLVVILGAVSAIIRASRHDP